VRKKRCNSLWGHWPWSDMSAGHGADSVAGAMRGKFLAS
jgi:hypothetical protein